ncbi:Hpt domain-containing protein [Candidatus Reidiella endopervernicosa]|uniref:Hpt domain-containing protein n=1 Tax=Candidatus Reidiella endopervernicosa TaxID=2738883 RepID=A0A6N0HYF0_9GAMM|nr:Hpt domain-containing protein [Candidatus Reidiella endopervernicosa]QKQ27369.1 Hpt domain-containing protein [Candidatus Reidiella endopervernicosa]
MRGNRPLFEKIVREFYDDHRQDLERVISALAADDLTMATLLTHTLKGAADNLGATELSLNTSNLEVALKHQEDTHLAMEKFIAAFERVMNGIKQVCYHHAEHHTTHR